MNKKSKLVTTLTAFSLMSSAFILKSMDDNELVGFKVRKQNDYNDTIYSAIIDTNYFDQKYVNIYSGISFAENTSTDFYDGLSNKAIKDKLKLIIPLEWSSFGSTFDSIVYNDYNFSFNYQEDYYLDCYNNEIILMFSEVKAKKNIYDMNLNLVINEGDSISSVMVNYNGRTVVYNQFGIGASDKFIADNNIGDADMALADIASTFDLMNSVETTYPKMLSLMHDYDKQVYGLRK